MNDFMHKPPFLILFVLLLMIFNSTTAQQKTNNKKQPEKKGVKPKQKPTKLADETEEAPKDTVKVTFGRNIVNLKTFNGWIIDERGKWVSSPNRIPFENPDFNNELYARYKIGFENIRQINIVEVKIDSTPYLAFIIEQDKGFFRDSAKTEFKYYVAADFFLVRPEDFVKLWSDTLKMNRPYEATLRAYYSGLVGYKDVKMRPKYMSLEINKDLRNRKYTDTAVKIYLQFGMKPVQNKKGKFMRFYYGLEYARAGEPVTPFDFNVFRSRYYEASLDLFHKFSRPKSIPYKKPTKTEIQKKPEKKPDQPKDNDSVVD
jgi:hypothetical protein